MAITFPTPVRIAAGVVGTTIDHLTTLPQELPTLGVSLVGQVFRTTLRVRQTLAELAVRGDDLLAGISGQVEEHPAWATIDDEMPQQEQPAAQPAAARTTPAGSAGTSRSAGTDRRGARAGDARPGSAGPGRKTRGSRPAGPAGRNNGAPQPSQTGPAGHDAEPVADHQDDAPTATVPLPEDVVLAKEAADRDRNQTSHGRVAGSTGSESAESGLDGASSAVTAALEVPDLQVEALVVAGDEVPDLDELTVSELKDRLPDLDEAGVRGLLAREEAGAARPAHLTLLENRVTTLEHDEQ